MSLMSFFCIVTLDTAVLLSFFKSKTVVSVKQHFIYQIQLCYYHSLRLNCCDCKTTFHLPDTAVLLSFFETKTVVTAKTTFHLPLHLCYILMTYFALSNFFIICAVFSLALMYRGRFLFSSTSW